MENVKLEDGKKNNNYKFNSKNPLVNLKIIKNNKIKIPSILPSISCGLFGYLGYEMIQYFEKVEMTNRHSRLTRIIFLRPSLTLVFDNVNDKLFITKIVSPSN